MKKIFAANWKMNGSLASITQLLNSMFSQLDGDLEEKDVIIFPPSPYIQHTKSILSNVNWHVGGQDLSNFDQGAYTGEVAASMLRDLGCTYVLVGHSERRHILGESKELVAQKFSQAIRHKLIPILCVGETLDEKNSGQTENIIDSQIQSVLDLPSGGELLKNGILAYEPVWAIGTGVAAKLADAVSVHKHMHSWLLQNKVRGVPIIYGGSVNSENAYDFISAQGVDGVLVGGASLDAHKFVEIIKCTK
jgi:triosephosphate isomerase